MKKFLSFLILIVIISMILLFNCETKVKASNEMYTLQFREINNKDIELYILLPKEYILFAIEKDGLDIPYEGVSTLTDNEIPSIKLETGKLQSETYEENDIEYIQILLDKNDSGNYEFDILSDYKEINIKYRTKGEKGDYIIHIDNFKIEKDVCEIEYDSEKNVVKQPDKKIIPLKKIIIIIIIVIVIVICIKKGSRYA